MNPTRENGELKLRLQVLGKKVSSINEEISINNAEIANLRTQLLRRAQESPSTSKILLETTKMITLASTIQDAKRFLFAYS